MKHSKDNVVDLDSGKSELDYEFDNIGYGTQNGFNLVEYLDHQIDTGLQKEVLFKIRSPETHTMVLATEPEKEDKYAELDVKRVQKWMERREKREVRNIQKAFFYELKRRMAKERSEYQNRRISYFNRSR